MQVNVARRNWMLLLLWVAAVLLQMPAIAAPNVDTTRLSKLVSGMYARYAWVAVYSTASPPNAVPLALANRAELQATFVPDLAKAIWEDAQCAAKRGEICTLDFDILFDSQDPSASELTVQDDAQGAGVRACFKVADGARKCLSFVGASVHGAARVADIVYPGQRSLRHLLGLTAQPVPKLRDATTGR